MLKNTSSNSSGTQRLIGGDFMLAENNADYSVINLIPEFPVGGSYRGNFHVVSSSENTVSVYDTTFMDEETAPENAVYSGYAALRWIETEHNSVTDTTSIKPRSRLLPLPVLADKKINSSGWLTLKMTRVATGAYDCNFTDTAMGNVKLKFRWVFSEQLPERDSRSDYLAVAGIIVTDEMISEIIQQQYGCGTLWLPSEISEESSSSSVSEESSSSSSSSSSEEKSESISESSSSSSSSSGESNEALIQVDLSYSAVSLIDINGNGIPVKMQSLVRVSGSFNAVNPYPQGGYMVTLSGTESSDYGDGEGFITENKTMEVTVVRNDTQQRWEVFNNYVNSWAEYVDEKNSDDDIDYSTPLYSFPYAKNSDFYPEGAIMVNHHFISGASYTPPENDLTSELVINFTKIK